MVGAAKVLGSAGRRRAGALLQHGSLLLVGSGRTPELPGLEGSFGGGEPGPPSSWAASVRGRIAGALGLEAVERGLDEAERAAVSRIAGAVYRDPAWTGRR